MFATRPNQLGVGVGRGHDQADYVPVTVVAATTVMEAWNTRPLTVGSWKAEPTLQLVKKGRG